MFLNAAKSFSSLTEEIADSLEFELLPQHINQANMLEKKINNRVRNVFKLAFASVIRDLTEAVSVSEVYNDESYKKNKALEHLQESEDLKKRKAELKQWKKLKEDLSWFVIHNEKLKSNMPYHFHRTVKRSKIMEAKGIYYRKVLLKKKITLKLVRWFKKRMGIKLKLRGDKIKNKLHTQKYKLMKPLIVRRLLKDIIACGFYSFMRERLIDILYDRKRKQLNKMKKAEKKYKSLVKFYQQKLAEANKFAVARRKIRERLIQLKILRIKTEVKTKIFKHLKRLGFATTREADDFHSSAMKHLQRLQKTGVSSTDHLVHFKSLNSDTFIKTIFMDLAKQGKLKDEVINKHEVEKRSTNISFNAKARLKLKKKVSTRKVGKNLIPLLKTSITKRRETESKQKSSRSACKLKSSSIKVVTSRFIPFAKKYRLDRRRREENKKKTSRKTDKTLRKKGKSVVKFKKYSRKVLKKETNVHKNVASSNSTLPSRNVLKIQKSVHKKLGSSNSTAPLRKVLKKENRVYKNLGSSNSISPSRNVLKRQKKLYNKVASSNSTSPSRNMLKRQKKLYKKVASSNSTSPSRNVLKRQKKLYKKVASSNSTSPSRNVLKRQKKVFKKVASSNSTSPSRNVLKRQKKVFKKVASSNSTSPSRNVLKIQKNVHKKLNPLNSTATSRKVLKKQNDVYKLLGSLNSTTLSRKVLNRQNILHKNVASLNSTLPFRKVRRKKRKFRAEGRRATSVGERNRKYPSILKENKLKTCTEKLIKAVPRKPRQTVKIKEMVRTEQAKRRLDQMKKTRRASVPEHNSDQLSTIFYKGLVDSLRSKVNHKSSVGSTSNHTPTIKSDSLEKQSNSDGDKISIEYSTTEEQAPPTKRSILSRKQLASERMEAEKKRLEETVLRSVETRFKEMMMEVPKDKDLKITNILGGYLARHAWKKFYTGKSSPCERVSFLQNSRNKPPPWGHYKLYRPLVYNSKIKYYLVVHGFDLTPRKFKSKKYPSCPVSYNALWFFSNILRDSKIRRNRIKYRYEFFKKESVVSQTSGGSQRFTLDEKSLFDGAVIPHLIFREENVNSQETEDDDVPPMFTLRQELKSSEPEDRQALQFKVFLTETETIDLITIESTRNYNLIEKKTSFGCPENYKPEKKLSKFECIKKKKKKNVFIDGMTPKVKEETLMDTSFISKPEKSITEFDARMFESRGVQVVTKTRRSTKVQVNAPSRKNTSTLVTLFDFTAEANREKTVDTVKSYHSKTSENEGSTSSDDFERERNDDPLIVTKSSDFKETLMYVQRILSSNIYKKSQMFYARYHVDPLCGKLPISYECVHLWTFHDYRIQLSQMTVSSIAPHPFDSNIIAVAYAKNELATRDFGIVCIWNIKNIFFPEQVIKFSSSVNYIEFSHPTTISVALMGGFVAVINISKTNHKITMNTERTTTAGFLPIWQFSWFLEENGEKFPVSCGADGRMYRYRTDETFAVTVLFEATSIENKLRGVRGSNSDFKTAKWKERPEMTACAQHPTDRQSYLVGTSEGTVHICSLLLRNHLEVFSAQEGRINAIKFHPHCEHVFLTVGGDFCVRIWAIGIFDPLLTYSARNEYLEDACFNQIWPELMISISGEFVDIWNIRRKVCVPVQSWSNPKQLKNTCIEFSTDGYSVIVGDVGGYVHSFRLSEMPCESKMKAEVLSQAIMSTLSERQDLIAALSKLGYPFSVTYIENFLKSSSSRKSEVV